MDEMIPIHDAVNAAIDAYGDQQTAVAYIRPRLSNGLVYCICAALTVQRGTAYGRDTLPRPFDRMPNGTHADSRVPKEFWERVGANAIDWKTGNFTIQIGSSSTIDLVGVRVQRAIIDGLPKVLPPALPDSVGQPRVSGPSTAGAPLRKVPWENFAAALAVVVNRRTITDIPVAQIYKEVAEIIQNSNDTQPVEPLSIDSVRQAILKAKTWLRQFGEQAE